MNKLVLSMEQKLSITPNLINSLKVLQLSSLDLERYIKDELMDNPILDMKVGGGNTPQNPDSKSFEEYTSEEKCFRDYLIDQIGEFIMDDKTRTILEILIYSLDDRGYLPENYKTSAELSAYNINEIEKAKEILLQLDPLGVGAVDLRECLLLQMDKDSENYEYKEKFINDFLYDLPDKSLEKVSLESNIDIECLENILDEIKTLNPIPSNGYRVEESIGYIIPEAVVKVHSDQIDIEYLNNDYISIQIDESYVSYYENVDDDAKKYIDKNITKARYLMDSIRRRSYTVNLVIKEIVEIQKEFFVNNDPLKPLRLKDIAKKTNLSISTISRAIKDKHIEASQGMFQMKYFFSNINYNSNSMSKSEIKDDILDMINSENQQEPLSDHQITIILNEKGVDISRRTVAKYRIELGIKNSYARVENLRAF